MSALPSTVEERALRAERSALPDRSIFFISFFRPSIVLL